MIKKNEVRHIAKLARLGITEKEEEKFRKDLSSILDYVDKLKKVDVAETEPTSHPLAVENVMRQDEARSVKPEARKKIIEQAPQTKNGYIKVKSVFSN